MKEKLYTIPLNDAVNAHDECPFCFIERKLERDTLDFVLGNSSSYMESDIREGTDKAGFCRTHFQKMFDYGNTLGNAWILKTHYEKKQRELQAVFKSHTPAKAGMKLFGKPNSEGNAIVDWIKKQDQSCYVCDHFKYNYDRYMNTFFYMYTSDEDFRKRVCESKGFCLTHFGDLCAEADKRLKEKDLIKFYDDMKKLMTENLDRLHEDVSWMIEKFDYRNKDADWKNSKDAIQRGMQKLKGGYPADGPYKPGL
jgi:hypothetical protein